MKISLKQITLSLAILGGLGLSMAPMTVHAEETVGEKAEAKAKDVKTDVKKGARHAKEKVCKEGDLDCKKHDSLGDKMGDAKTKMGDKADEVKNKAD